VASGAVCAWQHTHRSAGPARHVRVLVVQPAERVRTSLLLKTQSLFMVVQDVNVKNKERWSLENKIFLFVGEERMHMPWKPHKALFVRLCSCLLRVPTMCA
jgi:hypothetical protein